MCIHEVSSLNKMQLVCKRFTLQTIDAPAGGAVGGQRTSDEILVVQHLFYGQHCSIEDLPFVE